MQTDIDTKTYILLEYHRNPAAAMNIIAEYVKQFLIYKEQKSLDEAASCLNVSKGTLIRVRRKNTNLRTSTISAILDALIESKCPEPACLEDAYCQPGSSCKTCPVANGILSLYGLAYRYANGTP